MVVEYLLTPRFKAHRLPFLGSHASIFELVKRNPKISNNSFMEL